MTNKLHKHPIQVSVVIPSFNEADYLQECIDALLAQTVSIHEIIVVDNNSTDDSIKVAKQRYQKHPNIIFLHEPKQGIVFARNTGFNKATGSLLAKIDADTVVDPDWHEHLLHDIVACRADAWSGYVYGRELNPHFTYLTTKLFNFFTFTVNGLVADGAMLFGSNLAMTRSAWEAISGEVLMRNDIWEDLDIALLLHKHGFLVINSKHPRASIASRSANVSLRRFYRRLYGQSRVYKHHGLRASYIFSLLAVHLSMLIFILIRPFARIGQTWKRRPRLDQY